MKSLQWITLTGQVSSWRGKGLKYLHTTGDPNLPQYL
jgi:hypothetical protein